jgi:hypothetical protein
MRKERKNWLPRCVWWWIVLIDTTVVVNMTVKPVGNPNGSTKWLNTLRDLTFVETG